VRLPELQIYIYSVQINFLLPFGNLKSHFELELDRNSQLTLENKILLYKTMLKPIWTYGIQLPPDTSQMTRSIMISRYQTLKKGYIKEFCQRYRDRLEAHPNKLAANLMKAGGIVRRLERKRSINLANIPQLSTFE